MVQVEQSKKEGIVLEALDLTAAVLVLSSLCQMSDMNKVA